MTSSAKRARKADSAPWASDLAWWRARLDGIEETRTGISAICPAHDDHDPSLDVDAKAGKILWKCNAGCGQDDVLTAARGLEEEQHPAKSKAKRPAYDPSGRRVAFQVGGSWRPSLKPRGLHASQLHGGLARLDELPEDASVVLTEGHGPAIALNAESIPAVCTVTGKGGAFDDTGASFLLGRHVILSPDVGGDDHMDKVGDVVSRVAAEVLIAPAWPDWMSPNDDAAEYIARDGADAMRAHYAEATPWAATDGDLPLFASIHEVEDEEPEPLLLGRLDPRDHTILFGDGSAGKGVVSAWWLARLTRERMRVAIVDYERHARYEWKPRLRCFGADLDLIHIAQPEQAIWDEIDGIAEELHDLDVDLVVVDSVAYACLGAPVEDSTTAARYSSTIARIGLPVLSLAHTTKTDADPQHPFGSVFWSNGARLTIGLAKGDDGLRRILQAKKVNARAGFPPQSIDWAWSQELGPSEVPASLVEGEHHASAAERIEAAIYAKGWMTLRAVSAAVNADGGTPIGEKWTRTAMRADPQRFDVRGGKGQTQHFKAGPAVKNTSDGREG